METCTRKELLSLIGQLQHACCVVKPGRVFLRRMIELAKRRGHQERIRLSQEFKSDLRWWATFLPGWNGRSMMAGIVRQRAEVTVTSDASGNWGCGAFTDTGAWFQLRWPEAWKDIHITVKELLPIIIGAAVWGRNWRGKSVRWLCDNAAAVAIVNSGKSSVERAMHLLRCLVFLLAKFNVNLVGHHIPGVENGAADALSRDRLPLFHAQVPKAQPGATPLPAPVRQVLVDQQPDWMEVSWTNLFASIS